jgi:alpha-glucosidase
MLLPQTYPGWLAGVHHDGSDKYVSRLHPQIGESVRIRLRAPARAPLRRVVLRGFPDGEQSLMPLRAAEVDGPSRWWETDLIIAEPTTHYRFILEADDSVWHYSAAGPSRHVPLDSTDFRILTGYSVPGWLDTAVFYQIFPDRFANGNPGNDPRPGEFDYRGYKPATYAWESPPPSGQLFPLFFYGGDLEGVAEKLDYLHDLGVNALYLNPVFTAYSNHKYDVADYDHVDPHFGGDAALAALRRALDRRQMRYILDIVPNHCGYWHPWFQAAQADPDAPEASFFTFRDHPHDYATWLGVWTLPKLDYRSPELRRRMYEGHDSVFRRWLRPPFSADGWRVDVANMLGRQGETQIGVEVSQGIRRAVKSTRPDAYLMGENFFDASAQLQGDQWDGVMNYGGFTHPLWFWLAGYSQGAHGFPEPVNGPPWSGETLAEAWRSRLAAIPWAVARRQYNLLGSHDVPRIRTTVGGNAALHLAATAVLLTFPGVPGLYYGDEIGMADTPELGARGCMIWDEARWDRGTLEATRSLVRLRRQSTVLQTGGFQMLLAEADTIAYQREGPAGRFIVVAHRGDVPRPAGPLQVEFGGIGDGTRFVEHFSGREAVVAGGILPLPEVAQGAMVWIEQERSA